MRPKDLYPLKDLPHQRQIWSWISFDVANQSFTLIINTLLFSIFFGQIVVRDDTIDDRVWGLTFGASMLLTALLSPIAGAIADERAWKKEALVVTGLACGVLTCCLALIAPGQLWLAVLLYVPANFFFQIGENFLASFLPHLAAQDKMGRVSGFSWACAYSAAILLLVLTAAGMLLFKLERPEQWRPFFVFAGIWFVLLTIPTLIFLKEPPLGPPAHGNRNIIAAGFIRLGESFKQTMKFRDLAILLVASLFYGTGMNVIIFFASKLAEEYGFTQIQLVVFVGVICVSGVFGTLLPMLFQDRIGHRRMCLLLLLVWVATTIGFAVFAFIHDDHVKRFGTAADFPTWPMWLIGNLLGFGLGSLGSANRAFVSYLAPPSRSAEVFGIWGLVFKLAAITTFPFAWVKDTAGTPKALIVLAGFMIVGAVITLFINEKRGAKAAADAEALSLPAATPSTP